MTQRVTVLGEHLKLMLPEHVYEFLGRGSLFSYQSYGTGSAKVEVSNDLKNWITLFDVSGTDSIVLMHPWKYQRVTNTDNLEVHVLQGRH
jgi:hypothetical protein